MPGIDNYDFFARYYDPKLGRFYGLDPVPNPGSPYAYCNNNPLYYRDPTGMCGMPDFNDPPPIRWTVDYWPPITLPLTPRTMPFDPLDGWPSSVAVPDASIGTGFYPSYSSVSVIKNDSPYNSWVIGRMLDVDLEAIAVARINYREKVWPWQPELIGPSGGYSGPAMRAQPPDLGQYAQSVNPSPLITIPATFFTTATAIIARKPATVYMLKGTPGAAGLAGTGVTIGAAVIQFQWATTERQKWQAVGTGAGSLVGPYVAVQAFLGSRGLSSPYSPYIAGLGSLYGGIIGSYVGGLGYDIFH